MSRRELEASAKRVLANGKHHGERANLRGMHERIVSALLDDLTDRQGLEQEWRQIDKDIQVGIVIQWMNIVCEELDL